MKKVAVIMGLLALVCLSSCRKDKVCRCAVRDAQTIRLITIDRGKCEDLRFVYYDRDHGLIEKDQDLTDSVLCTAYRFEGDPDDIRTL